MYPVSNFLSIQIHFPDKQTEIRLYLLNQVSSNVHTRGRLICMFEDTHGQEGSFILYMLY